MQSDRPAETSVFSLHCSVGTGQAARLGPLKLASSLRYLGSADSGAIIVTGTIFTATSDAYVSSLSETSKYMYPKYSRGPNGVGFPALKG